MERELMLKAALLELELESIKKRLEFVRLFKSEKQKDLSSPSSSMSQEENVGISNTELQKDFSSPSSTLSQEENVSILKNTEQQEVNVSPPLKRKETSNPEQTAPGKDISKPLKVVDLPKIQIRVQTPTTLVTPSDFNLRPNGGIQIPKPEGSSSESKSLDKGIQIPKELLQIPNKNTKPYYVVFNRPNAGIFENWDVAKQAIDGVINSKHKRFNSFLKPRLLRISIQELNIVQIYS